MHFFLRFFCLCTLILTGVLPLNAQQKPQKFPVEGTNGRWFVDAERRLKDAKPQRYLGREALWLKNNSHVMLDDGKQFINGTIEFDVAPMKGGHFFALLFRRESFRHFENIYFRAHKSGKYNALQYAPAINGSSTWQLYPEFNRTIDFPREQWTHVRVEVKGSKSSIFLNEADEPILEVPRMRSEANSGAVAVWARINAEPNSWAAAISNFKVEHSPNTENGTAKAGLPPSGTITDWKVSKAFENKTGAIRSIPDIEEWKDAAAEESGLINLNRVVGSPRGRWTAYAKTNIKSDSVKVVPMNFGYSDDVTIFLNGKPIFSGINGWESRYPQYMGFVKLGNDSVYLDLKKGDNELVFAVTSQRFGWGFIAQIGEAENENQ